MEQIETVSFGNGSLLHFSLPLILPMKALSAALEVTSLPTFALPPISATAHLLSALTMYFGISQNDTLGAHKLTSRLPCSGARTSTRDCNLDCVLCVLCHQCQEL